MRVYCPGAAFFGRLTVNTEIASPLLKTCTDGSEKLYCIPEIEGEDDAERAISEDANELRELAVIDREPDLPFGIDSEGLDDVSEKSGFDSVGIGTMAIVEE